MVLWLSFLPQFTTDEFGDDVVDEFKSAYLQPYRPMPFILFTGCSFLVTPALN